MSRQSPKTYLASASAAVFATLLLSIFLPDRASAQQESVSPNETSRGDIAVGLSTGPRLSAFWGPDATGSDPFQATESRQTFSLGARAQYRLNPSWSLQAGLHYVRTGQKYKGISTGERYSSQVRLEYLRVPVLARARLFTPKIVGRTVSVELLAGPYISALLRAEENLSTPGTDRTDDISSVTRPVSWGGQVGVGISAPLSFGRVGIETRYNLGLRDISTSSVNVRNQGLVVALTFDVSI